MTVQPHLIPDTPDAREVTPRAVPPAASQDRPAPLWLQRMSLFILVLFCVYLGVIVTVIPWWKDVWDKNIYFTTHPQLWSILRLGPVRGVISGLGLLDVWIGVSEAVNYREHSAPKPEPHP